MSRSAAGRGLVPLADIVGDLSNRGTPRQFSMRKTTPKGDWFRIENKKSKTADDKTITKVYIYDEIGYWGTSAQDFIRQMMAIDTDEIHLHLNSPGGEIFDGVAIYNALKSHAAKVTVFVDALAASAASFIAQSGERIVMTRNATMMIHDGLAICIGNEADMLATADILNKLSNNIADIYAQSAGGDVETWREFMRAETWYNADEAVEAGLADEVADDSSDEGADTENKWDLTIFNHAGRANAPSPEQVRKTIFQNRAEEAAVARRTGTNQSGEGAEGTPAPAAPSADPQNQPGDAGTTAADDEAGTGSPDSDPDAQTTSDPASGSAGGSAGTPPPTGAFSGLLVNGVLIRDPSQAQAHINSLETFQKDTLEAGRRGFVKNLCDDKKIAATQVEATEEFALSLTAEQYTKWVASWESSPSVPVFGAHAAGSTNHDGTQEADPAATELATAKAIVRQHRLANMQQEQLEKTQSWAVLVKHNATDSV